MPDSVPAPRPTGIHAGTAPVWSAAWTSSRRRRLQVGLGILWLVDAGLQSQPYMFTTGFVTHTLAPAAASNPGVIADMVTWTAHVVGRHVAVYNAGFATIQLLLAAGILWSRTTKPALAVSIVWSLAVWWLGTGLGGVLAGGPSAFMGAPGAAVLYALVAVLVWPRQGAETPSVATSGPVGARLARLAWLFLWASYVYFTVQPGNRAADALSHMVSGGAAGEPGWIRSMDHGLGVALAGHGTQVSLAFAAIFVVVAFSVYLPARAARVGLGLAVACGLAIWVAEDFGAIFTGRGTDPNSGPLLVILAAAYWPAA